MFDKKEIIRVIEKLEQIKKDTVKLHIKYSSELSLINYFYKTEAINLLNYCTLRKSNLNSINKKLIEIGVPISFHIQADVINGINSVLNILYRLIGEITFYNLVSPSNSKNLLRKNTDALLGKINGKRKVRIMVNVPDDADTNYNIIKEMLNKGVNCFRINCALNNKDVWSKMIANINKAIKDTGKDCKILMDLGGTKIRTGKIKTTSIKNNFQAVNYLLLQKGDTLILHSDNKLGENAKLNKIGKAIKPAHVSISLPQVLSDVKIGERIIFDDGKIEGIIKSFSSKEMFVEITYTKPGGAKLKAEKGINFPDSNLSFSGLSQKDKEDIPFIIENADILSYSFITSGEDVLNLYSEFSKYNINKLGVLLKIENKKAYKNLTEIILAGMQLYPIGIMIARGDLAIELGWDKLANVQEEILAFGSAANIPVFWATQVLENAAKKGRPTRAEITDAAASKRAQCVMLNKGNSILEAIHLLDSILLPL